MKNDEIIAHYSRLLAEHGPTYRAGDHGSIESRRKRFDALIRVIDGDLEPKTILDVGCGTGDLAACIPPGDAYLGIDLSPAHIELARTNCSHRIATFHVADLMDVERQPGGFDYVVASGLFQFADNETVRRGIARMWELCRKAIAFNFLTKSDGTPDETQHDPFALATFCYLLSPRMTLRMDYLPNDATIYLYK